MARAISSRGNKWQRQNCQHQQRYATDTNIISVTNAFMNSLSDDDADAGADLFDDGKFAKDDDDVFGLSPRGKIMGTSPSPKPLNKHHERSTARSTSLPVTMKFARANFRPQSATKSPTFGSKAISKLNQLLGRSKTWSEDDPPLSLFSVEGYDNFFGGLDESALIDLPILEI